MADPELQGGGTIASPVIFRGRLTCQQAFMQMAQAPYQSQGLSTDEQTKRLAWLKERLPAQLTAIQAFADTTATHLERVKQPVFIAQGDADQMIDPVLGNG
ncbi:hypothetical protein L3X07_08480 [Levilactobacillus brevis]|nr:hypothetical protein [Levilactobacillus brevis]